MPKNRKLSKGLYHFLSFDFLKEIFSKPVLY